jgi:hypothetical protein
MALFFQREEEEKANQMAAMPEPETKRPLWQTTLYIATMVGVLVFANWGKPAQPVGFWNVVYEVKWLITGLCAIGLAAMLTAWFRIDWRQLGIAGLATLALALIFPQHPLVAFAAGIVGLSVIISRDEGEAGEWFVASWGFARQILPLLLGGILVSGLFLGRPGQEGLIPSEWIATAVGGNSFVANFYSSVAGAFMYFATLTEVPILQGLIGSGMGKGPALALLLAGPALSLPSMIVLRSILGTKKTVVYVFLVVVMATITGMLFGTMAG